MLFPFTLDLCCFCVVPNYLFFSSNYLAKIWRDAGEMLARCWRDEFSCKKISFGNVSSENAIELLCQLSNNSWRDVPERCWRDGTIIPISQKSWNNNSCKTRKWKPYGCETLMLNMSVSTLADHNQLNFATNKGSVNQTAFKLKDQYSTQSLAKLRVKEFGHRKSCNHRNSRSENKEAKDLWPARSELLIRRWFSLE